MIGRASPLDREVILRRFEQWLDEVLSREEPPAGVDAELLAALMPPDTAQVDGSAGARIDEEDAGREVDSYALWAAMTTLAHEVTLQGRVFKELHTTLSAQAGAAADQIHGLSRERERDLRRDVERRCRREMMGGLIDMRDRLERGLHSAHAAEAAMSRRQGRLARLLAGSAPHGSEAVAALVKGYELGLERLDQLLDDLKARRIHCEGEAFDPRRMNAIDRSETTTVPPGIVIEVYRNGYEWDGELFRPAQVKVACAPAMRSDDE